MTKTPEFTLVIEYRPVAEIKEYDRNPRQHPKAQLQKLENNIRANGQLNPILVDEHGVIIAGHARFAVARSLGMSHIPAIALSHLSEAQKRAYRIADNKIQESGTWDTALLLEEVEFILGSEDVIDLEDSGFEIAEIDVLLGYSGEGGTEAQVENVPPPDRSRSATAKRGDLWLIGDHRIYCGDALDESAFDALMNGQKAGAVVTDMPWNVPIKGHVSGLGKIQHAEFEMASGELSREQFRDMMHRSFTLQAAWARPGALHYQFIDWRSVADMIHVGEGVHDALINLAVWVKPNGGMGSLLRSRHELCCIFRGKGGRHRNNVELGKHGRYRTNVWEYPAPSGFGSERDNLALHPTCKNMSMVADAIMDSTKQGDLVLDPFLGSGTTILAAASCGRIGYGIEIDPHYVDVALKRLHDKTGIEPRLASQGDLPMTMEA